MVNLFSLALFGIFILIIMGIISNTSETAFINVENQIFLMNCPMPIFAGRPDPASLDIVGLTVQYDLIKDNSTEDFHITTFECSIDPITEEFQVSFTLYTTANNWFNASTGFLAYLMNGIFSIASKIQAFLTLFSFILSPANFEVFGFTLADIGGIGLMLVVAVYIVAYVFIGAWLWVTFNPFKGSA